MHIVKEKGKVLKLTMTDGRVQLIRGVKDWAIDEQTLTYRKADESKGIATDVARVVSRLKPDRKLVAAKHPKAGKVKLFDSVQAFLTACEKNGWPEPPSKAYIHSMLRGMHVETEWTFFYVDISTL
jgi:hypothetical protein